MKNTENDGGIEFLVKKMKESPNRQMMFVDKGERYCMVYQDFAVTSTGPAILVQIPMERTEDSCFRIKEGTSNKIHELLRKEETKMEDKTATSGRAIEPGDNGKLKAFAKHILEECEKEGFTVTEIRMLTFVYQNESNKYLHNLQDDVKFRIVEKI